MFIRNYHIYNKIFLILLNDSATRAKIDTGV